jgi:hypothetical protein
MVAHRLETDFLPDGGKAFPRDGDELSASPQKVRPDGHFNEAHRAWLNCVTKQVRTESFDDLWEIALSDYKKAHQIIEKAKLFQPDGKDDLRPTVHSQDHDGFHVGVKKKVFDLCWDRLPR